jgi:hypothetical protein
MHYATVHKQQKKGSTQSSKEQQGHVSASVAKSCKCREEKVHGPFGADRPRREVSGSEGFSCHCWTMKNRAMIGRVL